MLVCAAHTLAEVYPDPAPDCVGKQDEVGCREARAGGWQCRDPSACRQDGLKCSDSDVARRIGMSCSGWPGYNGGYPISKIHWDSENEYYECDTVASQNSTYCRQWLTIEDGDDEWEAGSCWCTHVHASKIGRQYCGNWSCLQLEVEKCYEWYRPLGIRAWRDEWGGTGWARGCDGADDPMCNLTWIEAQFPGYNVSRRGAWSLFPYTCLKKSTSRHSSYRWREEAPHVETEKADCGCLEANSMGACVRWYCREYDDAGLHDVEHEYYDATQLSSSGSRVDAWRGDIDSRGEFEMSECICTVPSANDMLCEKWECFEKGTAYFFPNLWWSALHVTLIILGPVFVFALADEETSGPVIPVECGFCCYGLFVLFAYPILFVWVGGIGELVIVISIFAPCLCCLCVGVIFAEPEEKVEDEEETKAPSPTKERDYDEIMMHLWYKEKLFKLDKEIRTAAMIEANNRDAPDARWDRMTWEARYDLCMSKKGESRDKAAEVNEFYEERVNEFDVEVRTAAMAEAKALGEMWDTMTYKDQYYWCKVAAEKAAAETAAETAAAKKAAAKKAAAEKAADDKKAEVEKMRAVLMAAEKTAAEKAAAENAAAEKASSQGVLPVVLGHYLSRSKSRLSRTKSRLTQTGSRLAESLPVVQAVALPMARSASDRFRTAKRPGELNASTKDINFA